MRFHRSSWVIALIVSVLACPTPSVAHVKWFEPYEISTKPVPMDDTLAARAFWIAAALVLALFLATIVAERTSLGRAVTTCLDRLTAPLRARADQFIVCIMGGFFVALFATARTILTPELLTDARWVGWLQLLTAMCLFSRRLYPFAAAGIIGLWLYALVDYDLFHMLDYVTLGFGMACYLVLASLSDERWRRWRFDALRLGIALALMWSSLEKFNYPGWFLPLLEKKPYLALGLPLRTFITMSGVAEFTLGFGLLWSPLVRRLSALMLFVVMLAAVYPFGRVDLIGHAIILGTLILVIAGAGVPPRRMPHLAPALARVPVGLAIAFVAFILGHRGVHDFIYGDDQPAWIADSRSSTIIRPGDVLPPHGHLFDAEPDDDDATAAPSHE
jgi:hypothetical protein